jgi:vacuolar-type H+-ATPase subunit H
MIRLTDLAGKGSFTMGGKKFEYGKVYSNPYATAFKPVNEAEGSEDHEVSMAQNQLDSIIKHATELKQKMGEQEKQIPAWIQDHITNSENYISQAASNYHEYGDSNEEKMNEAGPCWKGYKQVGMKNKNGKQVPNCVPEGVVKEGPMNLRGGVPKMYVAYLGLQKKVRELEDRQKELLQPYLAAKKTNNITAINKAVEALKKNQKSLDMYRRNLQKVEGEYITMLDRDTEYQSED